MAWQCLASFLMTSQSPVGGILIGGARIGGGGAIVGWDFAWRFQGPAAPVHPPSPPHLYLRIPYLLGGPCARTKVLISSLRFWGFSTVDLIMSEVAVKAEVRTQGRQWH